LGPGFFPSANVKIATHTERHLDEDLAAWREYGEMMKGGMLRVGMTTDGWTDEEKAQMGGCVLRKQIEVEEAHVLGMERWLRVLAVAREDKSRRIINTVSKHTSIYGLASAEF
jgi:hypothetical protein